MAYRTFAGFALAAALTSSAQAQGNFDAVEIETQEVAPGIAVLFGAGGNIGVSYGPDGVLLIDDQFAPLTDKILTAVNDLKSGSPHYIVNTHWHGDHTGGNGNLTKSGALIFAHDNVRIRLVEGRSEGENPIAPAPKSALPVVTYDRGITLHHNGDTIEVMFLGGGHTDGDSVVFWREDNVVHMGDLYFNIPGWPFIDTDSGGNVEHALFSMDTAIARMDENTKVIPGHGTMSNRAELIAYRNIVGEALTRVRALKDAGKTLDQTRAARPLDSFERGKGFIDEDAFIGAIWRSLEAHGD